MPEGVALARDLVGPAMESAIARLTPDVRVVAAYHLGLADAAGNPIRSGSGKALRPALTLLSARAANAAPESTGSVIVTRSTKGSSFASAGIACRSRSSRTAISSR